MLCSFPPIHPVPPSLYLLAGQWGAVSLQVDRWPEASWGWASAFHFFVSPRILTLQGTYQSHRPTPQSNQSTQSLPDLPQAD